MLSGWGLLWFIDGMKVRTFHTSTLQWLTRPIEKEDGQKEDVDLGTDDRLVVEEGGEKVPGAVTEDVIDHLASTSLSSPPMVLLRADASLGHQALAHLSLLDLLGELGGGEGQDEEDQALNLDATAGPKRRQLRSYSLRHALSHTCLANDLDGAWKLASLISFWQRLIADGHFSDSLTSLEAYTNEREAFLKASIDAMLNLSAAALSMDLGELPPSSTASQPLSLNGGRRNSTTSRRSSNDGRSRGNALNQALKEARLDHFHLLAIREVIHWLRGSSAFILKHPQSLPQLAQRAPRDSHVARTNGACTRVLQLDRTQARFISFTHLHAS